MHSQQLRLALLQMDVSIGQPEQNFATLGRMLEEAVNSAVKPDIVLLPEMWNTGYALEELNDLADLNGEKTKTYLSAFCKEHQVNVIAGSIAEKRDGVFRNTAYVFDRNGHVTADYSKIHLFRLMEEERYLTAGDHIGAFNIEDCEAGLMICYDIRFPELTRKLALGGAKILFVAAEWPHPRLHHWRSLLIARAIENQMYVVACNRVGTSGSTSFCGHSLVIDPWGEILAEGSELEEMITADISLDLVDTVRQKIPVFADRRPILY